MNEEQVAKAVSDEFETHAQSFNWMDFQDQAALITYYQAALRVVTERPFRNDFVQINVLAFLNKQLTHACELLLKQPLAAIRNHGHLFEVEDAD